MSSGVKPISFENFQRMVQSSKPTSLPAGALSLPVRIVKPAGPKKTISKRKNRRVNRKTRRSGRKTRRA